MTEEGNTTEAAPMTEEQIQAQMTEAVSKGDWALVKKLAGELDKLTKAEVAKAKEALQAKLAETTDKVKKVINKALKPMYDAGELDGADGVWYGWDFGSTEASCRITKTQKKAAGEGTSSGKSSYVAGFPPNKEMLAIVGNEVMFTEDTTVTIDKQEHVMPAGTTFAQAEAYSTNGGWRNRVRMQLGKAYTKATSAEG